MLGRRSVLLSALALGAALTLGGCGKSESFRYRMTVEVETPQGLRTGSSVIEVSIEDPGRGPLVLPGTTVRMRAHGEAVAVELPGGKVLFALLTKPGRSAAATQYAYDALRPSRHKGEYAMIERTRELKAMKGAGALREADYPMLVTFDDISDPASANLVDPNDLAATFGDGVSLKQIVVQITNDPTTFEIDKQLGWLRRIDGALSKISFDEQVRLAQEESEAPLANRIKTQDFLSISKHHRPLLSTI